MLAIPSKKSDDKLDWKSSLHKYLVRAHSPAVAEAHKEAVADVAEARRLVVGGDNLGSEHRRDAATQYYRLLGALEMRFASSELRTQFVWRDAFQTVVRMGENDLRYESAAVLFNLAAETSRAAIHEPRQTPEGLKVACARHRLSNPVSTDGTVKPTIRARTHSFSSSQATSSSRRLACSRCSSCT